MKAVKREWFISKASAKNRDWAVFETYNNDFRVACKGNKAECKRWISKRKKDLKKKEDN